MHHTHTPAIGFDADDTLWHCENHFASTQAEFTALLEPYNHGHVPLNRLFETEKRNMKVYGYGVKGFMLSMIETALEITDGQISSADIARIIDLGKAILKQKVELLPHVRSVLEELARDHRLLLITKGDLLDQEGKIARSGLAGLFAGIEIVSEKDTGAYRRLLDAHNIAPRDFVMVGNSLKSDIAPVLELGGRGIHVPYAITARHERLETPLPGLTVAASIADIPALIRGFRNQP
jgi:putative hydrolase of the HAD superfamily